ncbi:MAG: bifunctional isocitrate dehydrogenase kinase/phosphatase [Deltaproteobacteria bacterium]|nr:bifunctional isocitrate dehydrogenase kinase/phosphatase [Deltaproteobacteria bacterium]
MPEAAQIAKTILEGFDRHYRLFREISAAAKQRFERGDWRAVREASKARIQFYDMRVAEAVETVKTRFPEAGADESLWPQIKLSYITLLYDHKQPECAETFFNSVACRVLHRQYYRNEYIFWRPAISTEHLFGAQPTYRCYYPKEESLAPVLREILQSFGLSCPWDDLDRDVAYVERAVSAVIPAKCVRHANFQIQVLSSLFYRNKAAYLVGRAINGNTETPFVIPILRKNGGALFLDTICLKPENIGRIFSLARAYFMADMEVPSAFVSFLKALMPSKRSAELYTIVGLQKQGKTLLYRDLHEHLMHSSDSFVLAPGTKGMVMLVFTLPSFPFVFKVIRDWFEPPKDTDAMRVRDRYLLVKNHDRVGRMADTLEYSHVAFPRSRFSHELLDELQRLAPSMCEHDGDQIIIKHLWVERCMVPLDMYLRQADDEQLDLAIREYGNAIRELASANIFPGDLLLKNFGITRYGRVVFYDYDEIGYLTDYVFRRMPTSQYDDDDMRGGDWFSIGPNDVFPEQFPTFLLPPGKPRELFMKYHGDLADPAFWIAAQERCRSGEQADLFPYPETLRFRYRFKDAAE